MVRIFVVNSVIVFFSPSATATATLRYPNCAASLCVFLFCALEFLQFAHTMLQLSLFFSCNHCVYSTVFGLWLCPSHVALAWLCLTCRRQIFVNLICCKLKLFNFLPWFQVSARAYAYRVHHHVVFSTFSRFFCAATWNMWISIHSMDLRFFAKCVYATHLTMVFAFSGIS